jgi:predicted acylesterase/phospholipase RssA
MLGKINEVKSFDFNKVQTLVLAGGGNRCWWQVGLLKHLLEQDRPLPAQWVGTSAGAAIGASFLANSVDMALQACLRLFADNPKVFDWRGLLKLKLRFANQHIYPVWVEAFLNADTFATLRGASSRLTVALTRPARYLGTGGSVAAGTLAYLVDKYLWNSLHPRLPGLLGLRQEFITLNDCADLASAQTLLVAAASAPPFISARRVGGRYAIDGGYTDNAPIPPQPSHEPSNTLVLLTRHYPKLPQLFGWLGRTYWQPSQRIPVSTWDCTPKTTVREAYELGVRDSVQAVRTGLVR